MDNIWVIVQRYHSSDGDLEFLASEYGFLAFETDATTLVRKLNRPLTRRYEEWLKDSVSDKTTKANKKLHKMPVDTFKQFLNSLSTYEIYESIRLDKYNRKSPR